MAWTNVIPEIVSSVATRFSATASYAKDKIVWNDSGDLFRAKEAITPGAWDSSKWEEVVLADLFEKGKLNATALCPNWTAMPYSAGSAVTTPEGNYYIANAATAATDIPGTSAKWTPVTIQEKLNLKADDIDLAETFDGAKVYVAGALVMHNGDLYRAKVAHAADVAWDDANWERTNIAENLKGGMDTTLIAPNHNAASTYVEGQLVIHNAKLYRAKADIDPAKAWDDADWEMTNIAANLGGPSSDFHPEFIRALDKVTALLGLTYTAVQDAAGDYQYTFTLAN